MPYHTHLIDFLTTRANDDQNNFTSKETKGTFYQRPCQRRWLGVGVSKDTGLSDLLMVILVKEVRTVDTVSDWILRRLVDQEGF